MFCFIITGLFSYAQTWEVGAQGGFTQYFGDVTNEELAFIGNDQDAFGGLFLRKYFGDPISVRLNALIAEYSGNDISNETVANRGFAFTTDAFEFSAQVEYHILGRQKAFSPYIFGGLGILRTNANANFQGGLNPDNRLAVNMDQALSDANSAITFPIGVGLNFHPIPDNLMSFGLEYSLRPTTYDLLDGISNAGDPDANDFGGTLGVVVGFPIGKVPDADGDGISDKKDACPSVPGIKLFDGCPDSDSDGIVDSADNCPNQAGTSANGGCPDSDGDGVLDKDDNCPNIAGLTNLGGCPDSDGDGIRDSNDDCPNTKGARNMSGCPDSDGDGVRDRDDDCPNEKGLRNNKGCPNPDSDGDGVADVNDNCPEVVGSASLGGCPDSDGDNVADKDDACPTVAGTLRGCPDTDKDGIADKDDKCPNKGGNIDERGCPKVDTKVLEVFSRAMNDVRFETSSNRLKQSSISVLNEVVDIMKANPSYNVRISGHTDSVGNADSNQSLSERRAAAVVDYLVNKGVNRSRLSSVGFGETSPMADNNTAEGRRLNRRVELRVVN